MKRIISFLLVLAMVLTLTTPIFAEDQAEYCSVQVEYSDKIGQRETLDLMIQGEHVFVDAEMLAKRLGYQCSSHDEYVFIYNQDKSDHLPYGGTKFRYGSKQVTHSLLSYIIDTYTAPFASIKNEKGSWIPFEYALRLLNSGMMMVGDALLIDIPAKNIIDFFYDIKKNQKEYKFDWEDDFGYTELVSDLLGINSHLINVFSGILKNDGDSWAAFFQSIFDEENAYDKKYGEQLTTLLCTESEKELKATSEKVKLINDLLNENGELGKSLSFQSHMLDFEVGNLHRQCEAVWKGIKAGNTDVSSYNRSYQALEDALDKQTWFSRTGGRILQVQKEAGGLCNALTFGTKIAEIVVYVREFQNHDDFSLSALTNYLQTGNEGISLPSKMKDSMIDHTDALSGDIDGYFKQVFLDHVDDWVIKAIKNDSSLRTVFNSSVSGILLGWNIAANTIPFIKTGLSSADSFELAVYGSLLQEHACYNYREQTKRVFSNTETITAENLYHMVQYAYIYLKSCYLTREAALATLAHRTSSTIEQIQPLIDTQNKINTEIAKILIELKGAQTSNQKGVYGFLPVDNEEYLLNYDDKKLIEWMQKNRPQQALNEWKQVYIDYINQQKTDLDSQSLDNAIGKLVNIDGDDIPELYINFGSTAQGDVICAYIGDGKTIQLNCYNYGLFYIEGKNILLDSGGHMDSYYDHVYSIKDDQFVLLASGESGIYSYDPDSQFEVGQAYYEWNGKDCSSEQQYINHLNRIFDSSKATTPFDGAEYDSEAGRYAGNGLCDLEELIDAIQVYPNIK